MTKILLIIKREYLTRVRKKSFIIMSFLGPFIFAAFLLIPAWLATREDKEVRTIAVVDSTGIFNGILPETEYIKFRYLQNIELDEIRNNFKETGYSALLFIPHNLLASNSVMLYSEKEPGLSTKIYISNSIENEIEKQKLSAHEIKDLDRILKSIETRINLRSIIWTEKGEKESFTELSMIIGYASGMLIYFFIFLFGAQVMRGVIEEKSSRIIEIIISSVKPFQLMMGKIIGVGLSGLTQFVLWVFLTLSLVTVIQRSFFPDLTKSPTEQIFSGEDITSLTQKSNELKFTESKSDLIKNIYNTLDYVNIFFILSMFLFFFIGGYLLYASFFAIIGSVSDSEADTQQFMFPVTVPLIAAIFVMINAINNPDGQLAFWFSMIPLTSPVVMIVRIPFGIKIWELVLSGSLLIITFVLSTWMAGKIYRTGILMYGKKVSYRELWKWLRYKT